MKKTFLLSYQERARIFLRQYLFLDHFVQGLNQRCSGWNSSIELHAGKRHIEGLITDVFHVSPTNSNKLIW